MKAVDRFDPNKGVRLVSFAVHWIKAEIHEYILKNWRMVKIATTKAQRKLFFNLRSKKKGLEWLTKDEAEQIAKDLDVDVKDVYHMEEFNLHNQQELAEAISTLDERSKDIIFRRYLSEDKVTLHDLAEEYEVSAERIRQIENAALKKLKSAMSNAA